jgi:hypothetical protein
MPYGQLSFPHFRLEMFPALLFSVGSKETSKEEFLVETQRLLGWGSWSSPGSESLRDGVGSQRGSAPG